ncbi:MAG: cupin domain-containing protein [Candidatus Bathyarchaeota archaeon]|nr:MAG: cupin domain-containing protein [Candidatus Bathyarchaeota archaeon]
MGFKTLHFSEAEVSEVTKCGAEGTKIRWLITKEDGAAHFAMRYFEMAPKGHSPNHSHEWEHEVFILDGECLVVCGSQRIKVGPGYAVFIPPNTIHHFRNEGTKDLKFLCLVPHHE